MLCVSILAPLANKLGPPGPPAEVREDKLLYGDLSSGTDSVLRRQGKTSGCLPSKHQPTLTNKVKVESIVPALAPSQALTSGSLLPRLVSSAF